MKLDVKLELLLQLVLLVCLQAQALEVCLEILLEQDLVLHHHWSVKNQPLDLEQQVWAEAILHRGSIKGQAPGKLSGCEDNFAW